MRSTRSKRLVTGLLLLGVVSTSTGCRALRARALEERLDALEHRVTVLETLQEARPGAD